MSYVKILLCSCVFLTFLGVLPAFADDHCDRATFCKQDLSGTPGTNTDFNTSTVSLGGGANYTFKVTCNGGKKGEITMDASYPNRVTLTKSATKGSDGEYHRNFTFHNAGTSNKHVTLKSYTCPK